MELMEQALARAAGAPLVPGNAVRLLRDASENYPAWLDAIRSAQHSVHFESYIIHEDAAGTEFAEALKARARDGVRVRVVYDWLGGVRSTSRRFWRDLRSAGVEVRCFNPPSIGSPFGWLSRDHRKSIVVDGQVAFVTGLCVGHMWTGDPERGIAPWRDTGVEIRGPAVADVERAFAQVWAVTGPPLPADARDSHPIAQAGNVAIRIVASTPWSAGLFRLDQLIAAAARRTLWLTDAYFAGIPAYIEAMRAAARDGVDVRLLVPGTSDIPILRPLSEAGYRTLLTAGIRVFEWKGPMLHAKTAVADGRWSRVGSSNLNVASWLGNYELDAVIEDAGFAEAMERMYLEDLGNATEIVLGVRRPRPRERRARGRARASAGRMAAGAIRLGNVVNAAMTDRRVLASVEHQALIAVGALLVAVAGIFLRWPRTIAVPIAILVFWVGAVIAVKASRSLLRPRRRSRKPRA